MVADQDYTRNFGKIDDQYLLAAILDSWSSAREQSGKPWKVPNTRS